jgi:invasion protein IalB
MLRLAIAFCVLLALGSGANAEKRVALVIGNGAYVKVPRLPNPVNDSTAMAGLLRKAGFDVVEEKSDLRADAMRGALRDFSEQVRDADIAVVFYAGHGMEMNGVNYLIPVDAALARDVDVEDEAVSLDRVIRTIEPARRLQLVIFDSCRDNPFLRSMRRTVISRSVRSGHGDIDEKTLPPNTLIAFAQKAGATAEDGTDSNSPYTTALLKHLPTPGLDVELALRRVRDEVLQATHNRQEPFKYGSLGGAELPLVPAAAAPPPTSPPTTAPARQKLSEVAEAWDRVKDSTNIAILETFIARYRGTFYADLASSRLAELRKQQVAAVTQPVPAPAIPRFPPKREGQSAWVKLCEKANAVTHDKDGKEEKKEVIICLTHHERLNSNSGEVVVSAAVRQIKGEDKQHFVVLVPQGMLIQHGMRVSIYPKDQWKLLQNDEKIDETRLKGIKLAYTLCRPASCTAEVEATDELLNDLKTSGGFVVFAVNSGGQWIGLAVPLDGFANALAGPPVDNQQYAKSRRELLDQIKQRQQQLKQQQLKQ